jgi:hypothetical protein
LRFASLPWALFRRPKPADQDKPRTPIPGLTQLAAKINAADTFMFLNIEDDHGIVTGWMTYPDCAIGKHI